MKSSEVNIRAISQEMPQSSTTEILKITYLKFHSNFPGGNELSHQSISYTVTFHILYETPVQKLLYNQIYPVYNIRDLKGYLTKSLSNFDSLYNVTFLGEVDCLIYAHLVTGIEIFFQFWRVKWVAKNDSWQPISANFREKSRNLILGHGKIGIFEERSGNISLDFSYKGNI